MKCAADVDAGQERVDEMRRELVDILGYQGQRRCRRDPSGPDVALMASPAPALAILSHFYFAISPSVQACKNKSHSLFADTCARFDPVRALSRSKFLRQSRRIPEPWESKTPVPRAACQG